MNASDFTYEVTEDYKLIRRIVVHPKLWNALSDDFAPLPQEYNPPRNPALIYVLARDHGEVMGFWLLVKLNTIRWEIHTCLLPHTWGKAALAAAIQMRAWIWANTDCQRLVTQVPAFNRLALRFAQSAGLEIWGTDPQSYQKNGKLHDLIMLGVSRPTKET